MVDSFSSSFSEARGKFLAAACDGNARIHTYGRDDVAGKDNERLACDVAVLGNEHAERAAIIVSGTHGAEGYCGSAILHQWLKSLTNLHKLDDVKIILVHAINPWSFSHKTRTTENKVDLNRNFFRDESGYNHENPSYEKLAPFLHADVLDAREQLAAYEAYRRYLDDNGAHIESESWTGQSQRPDGMFYTGKAPEWSNGVFRTIVRDHLASAKIIGFIDWHTCIGKFGEVVHLVFDDAGSPAHKAASHWWGLSAEGNGLKVGAIPKYEGLLCKAIGLELESRHIAGAVIEFGTVDEFALFRADRLDRWLSFEGRNDPQHDQLREEYLEACCPSAIAWRRLVLSEGPRIMDQLIGGIRNWE